MIPTKGLLLITNDRLTPSFEAAEITVMLKDFNAIHHPLRSRLL
jgi:hypothetical protein